MYAMLLFVQKWPSTTSLEAPSRALPPSVKCVGGGPFFQATFNYTVPEKSTIDLSDIACRIFEGLAKPGTLVEENTSEGNNVEVGTKLHVPLKCACPDNFSNNSGVKYLVTYPLVEGDAPNMLSEKFSISPIDLWVANNFQPWPTIYPNTTVLIPLKRDPVINFSIPRSLPPSPGFLPTILVQKTSNTQFRNLYIAGSVVGFILLLAALVVCRLQPRLRSLRNYSIEDLKRVTDDFSEERKIGDQAYKGLKMDNAEMMIKLMRFEQTRQVIDIRSKINHINILNLLGVCYGENDYSWSYLVFELPSNGCLRDSTNPAVGSSRGNENIKSVKGCVAPEYVVDGSVFEKVDIFAFGVVLLELISGKDDVDGKSFKECIVFLGRKTTEGGCFDGLRSFMDPCLKKDYPLAEALCLTVLAKACVEEDPLQRPSMDDIMKVLVRMVRRYNISFL
ncbi:hypothetical protein NC652_022612 [Populus alba x Populus x berolinensis]|nr:hypothetical protein NC652_022612 [Populus alba x Populus x berolinensis]